MKKQPKAAAHPPIVSIKYITGVENIDVANTIYRIEQKANLKPIKRPKVTSQTRAESIQKIFERSRKKPISKEQIPRRRDIPLCPRLIQMDRRSLQLDRAMLARIPARHSMIQVDRPVILLEEILKVKSNLRKVD